MFLSNKSVHSGQLERWLGKENVEHLSKSMGGWYGPPIAVHGVPGNVYATGDGDFIGNLRAGYETSALDRGYELLRRMKRSVRIATGPAARNQLNAGFASLSDLISEATSGGKRQELPFQKLGSTGVVSATNTLWRVGNMPSAGGAGANTPGGAVCYSNTTGALVFTNPAAGDTLHFVAGNPAANIGGNTLLLYDRLWHATPNVTTNTAIQGVTGVPSRYQNTTGGQPDSIAGNFFFIEVFTALPATAHNWTVCKYTNQAGTTGQTMPSMAGNSSAIIDRLDHPINQWFMPLAAGDTGIKNLTQFQCSGSMASGAVQAVIGHPLAWMPCPIANLVCTVDGINTAFNLTRIFDDACLAFLEVNKPATTVTTYTGSITLVSG